MWQVIPISSTFFSQNFGKLLLINVSLDSGGGVAGGVITSAYPACEKHEINEKISLVIWDLPCAGNFYFHMETFHPNDRGEDNGIIIIEEWELLSSRITQLSRVHFDTPIGVTTELRAYNMTIEWTFLIIPTIHSWITSCLQQFTKKFKIFLNPYFQNHFGFSQISPRYPTSFICKKILRA